MPYKAARLVQARNWGFPGLVRRRLHQLTCEVQTATFVCGRDHRVVTATGALPHPLSLLAPEIGLVVIAAVPVDCMAKHDRDGQTQVRVHEGADKRLHGHPAG